ncbi:DNA-dependent RNA polymerase I subunit A43 [Ophiocordyceps camponoti-floridani]|uniref:DNA-directed RNA polymerase subunit n=1 Tax=Ophiocordyceps camponoti-floridani TaxID=2030778 RepID=A0A8H4Q278_9HYPO|nr:DNA-dependent RNA polymerase I subunit A43 [Ophiocordyceps camponoti-floridani]
MLNRPLSAPATRTSSTRFPTFDAMEVDAETNDKGVYGPPDMPDEVRFPFFSQTVSLYLPLWPNGWETPVTSAQEQHFKPMLNNYVPYLHGVLLKYDKIALGARPGRRGAASSDDEPTTVQSRNEYGVGFGWVTADVELFMPRRGSWMEGTINLQTEGHIGVVCFGKFNASIEAVRLPQTWKWVSEDHEFEQVTAAPDEYGVVQQLDSTGFWVDDKGARVQGKIRFRIRNFDAGSSGESSYLSLEGTMLDEKREKELSTNEARTVSLPLSTNGGRRRVSDRRAVPASSLTCLASEQQPQQPATGDRTGATGAEASGGKDAVEDRFEAENVNLAAALELQSEIGDEEGGFESDD